MAEPPRRAHRRFARHAAAALTACAAVVGAGAARAQTPDATPSDSMWYLRLGYGGVHARRVTTGPAVGIGWRYVPQHLGVDVSVFNFVFTSRGGAFDNVSGSFVKAAARYEISPRASATPFAALGLGWGTAGATIDETTYRGSGLDVGITVGYMRRVSPALRLLVQLDATLPTYRSHASVLATVGSSVGLRRDALYAPSLALTLGVAFDGSTSTP